MGDVCFQAGTFGGKYLKYSCSNDGATVTKNEYSTSVCSGLPYNSTTWTSSDKSPCGGDKFSCNGLDQYSLLDFYNTGFCLGLSLFTLPLANGCYCATSN